MAFGSTFRTVLRQTHTTSFGQVLRQTNTRFGASVETCQFCRSPKMLSNRLENGGGLVGVVSREHCGMTAKGFVQSFDLAKMLSADVHGAAGG